MEKRIKEGVEPEYFIEQWKNTYTSEIRSTYCMKMCLLERVLLYTNTFSTLKTIAVFKIYPHKSKFVSNDTTVELLGTLAN